MTYYVDGVGGSDGNPGSLALPWRTIQKAASSISAADTVVVLAGSYDERVQVTRSGAPSAPITFQAVGDVITNGFTVRANYITIKGFEVANTINDDTQGVGIFVEGSDCDIENNYVHDTTRQGIYLFAPPTNYSQTANCVVRNNRIYRGSQAGIAVRGDNHLIEGNEVWATVQYPAAWTNPPSWVDADGIQFFGSGHIIRKNYVHDIPVETPENKNPHVDCYETWVDSSHLAAQNVILEQNRCSNVQAKAQNSSDLGSGFQIRGASGLIIRNNVIDADAGILLYSSSAVNIVNNDFVGSLATNPLWYPVGAGLHGSTGIIMQNNIFYNQPAGVINVTNSTLQSDHNLEYRNDRSPLYNLNTYNHTGDLWGIDPLFVNGHAGDYHLQAGSPAIDAGASLSNVPVDFDGVPRPQGSGFDIGAYEYR